jgi:hypothetical protein
MSVRPDRLKTSLMWREEELKYLTNDLKTPKQNSYMFSSKSLCSTFTFYAIVD